MRSATEWLSEYGESHRNPTNKALHWFCVPIILWCVLGLGWLTPFPAAVRAVYPLINWASLVVLAGLIYYALLSLPLALGALPVLLLALWSIAALQHSGIVPLGAACLSLFVLAWIGQFIGHAIEGRRPSFFKDVQFLLIGPLWLLADLYRRLGIPY